MISDSSDVSLMNSGTELTAESSAESTTESNTESTTKSTTEIRCESSSKATNPVANPLQSFAKDNRLAPISIVEESHSVHSFSKPNCFSEATQNSCALSTRKVSS